MATLNIMDVSRWQGNINWDAVKRSGKVIRFFFDRAKAALEKE